MLQKQLVLDFSKNGSITTRDPHKRPRSIMFVCQGNIIRSPLIEGYFRKIVNSYNSGTGFLEITLDSSAVDSYNLEENPADYSQQIAIENGFDISKHVSKLITKKDFQKFDLIVSLDPYVFAKLQKLKPANAAAKVIELLPGKYVTNPYMRPRADFDRMFEEIQIGVSQLIKNYFPELVSIQ